KNSPNSPNLPAPSGVPAVERRRRDKINNWIVQLSKIIPDCGADSGKSGASKGGILSKACDYVRELRQSNQRLQETFKEAERLQMDNDLFGAAAPGQDQQLDRAALQNHPRLRRRQRQIRRGESGPGTPGSKGGILSKACDYVRELRQSNQRLQETFKEAERLQMDNDL
ncbi:upstream stimulatory factor 2-like, partial [Cyanistes caeruleus]|uniref:upstream stimulatory factor 2-like n=1 Tax=Cyanistes caeruleus TaxID=156563 RepID=UPI000CDA2BC9